MSFPKADVLVAAVRLLAQAAEAQALSKRYHDAGLAMLSELGDDFDLSPAAGDLVRLAKFRAACAERAITLTADEHVTEAAAADLLAVARSTLATWRQMGHLSCRRTPGGHVQYSLAELAEFVGKFARD